MDICRPTLILHSAMGVSPFFCSRALMSATDMETSRGDSLQYGRLFHSQEMVAFNATALGPTYSFDQLFMYVQMGL